MIRKINYNLRNYQREDAEMMASKRFFLNASELGTGKTATALTTTILVGSKKTLVICPASIKMQWEREIRRWVKPPVTIQIIDNGDEDVEEAFGNTPLFIIINYDLIIRDKMLAKLKGVKWDVIICDESHRLKSLKAKRTKSVLSKEGLVHHTKRMYLLTGTPVLNRPIELYPMLSVLAPELLQPYDTWHRYVYQFCGAYEDRFGLHTNGATNLLDLRDRLENIMVRRLADGNLPDMTVQDIEVALTKQVWVDWYTQKLADEKYPKPMATVRRKTAGAKMPMCISFIKDVLEEVDKVVVFFFHREIANRLMVGLEKYNPLIVIGGMAVKDKQETVDLFNKKKHKVFLLQINCAEGINGLQDTAHVGIFVEQEWSPSIVKQAVGRLSRHGQKHPVLIYNLVTQGGIEERIEKVLRKKEKIIGKLYE